MVDVEAEPGLVAHDGGAGDREGQGAVVEVHAAEAGLGPVEAADPFGGGAQARLFAERVGGRQAEAPFARGLRLPVEGGVERASALRVGVGRRAGQRERGERRDGEPAEEALRGAVIAQARAGGREVGLAAGVIRAAAGGVTAEGVRLPASDDRDEGDDALLVREPVVELAEEILAFDPAGAAEEQLVVLGAMADGHAGERVAEAAAEAGLAGRHAAVDAAGARAEVAGHPCLAVLAHAVIGHQRAVVGAFEGEARERADGGQVAGRAGEGGHPFGGVEQHGVGVDERVRVSARHGAVADDDVAVGGDPGGDGARAAGEEAQAGHHPARVRGVDLEAEGFLVAEEVAALAHDDLAVGADRVGFGAHAAEGAERDRRAAGGRPAEGAVAAHAVDQVAHDRGAVGRDAAGLEDVVVGVEDRGEGPAGDEEAHVADGHQVERIARDGPGGGHAGGLGVAVGPAEEVGMERGHHAADVLEGDELGQRAVIAPARDDRAVGRDRQGVGLSAGTVEGAQVGQAGARPAEGRAHREAAVGVADDDGAVRRGRAGEGEGAAGEQAERGRHAADDADGLAVADVEVAHGHGTVGGDAGEIGAVVRVGGGMDVVERRRGERRREQAGREEREAGEHGLSGVG